MSGCGKSSRLLSAFPPACGSHAGLRGHIVCCAHAWRLKYNPAGSCMGLAALVLLRDWADRGRVVPRLAMPSCYCWGSEMHHCCGPSWHHPAQPLPFLPSQLQFCSHCRRCSSCEQVGFSSLLFSLRWESLKINSLVLGQLLGQSLAVGRAAAVCTAPASSLGCTVQNPVQAGANWWSWDSGWCLGNGPSRNWRPGQRVTPVGPAEHP